jgi:type IV pilus assembly protein PilC
MADKAWDEVKSLSRKALRVASPSRAITLDRRDAEKQWFGEPQRAKRNLRRFRRSRLKVKEVAWLLSQLATTQTSGITPYRSLGMIAQMRNDLVGQRANQIQEALSEGSTLSTALRKLIPEAGPLAGALIAAGEASGGLESALRRAAELLESRLRLRRKIRAALTYPAMVVVVTSVLIGVLLVVVVPRFEEIYTSSGGELPALTQTIINMSKQVPLILGILVALAIGLFVLLRRSRSNVSLAYKLDKLKMKFPLLGSLVRKGALARVATTISSLVGSGVPISEALGLASQTAGSSPFATALSSARERVGEGRPLSKALADSALFPTLMIQLIEVGEETGSMVVVLEKYAQTSSEELEEASESLTRLIEPLMMVFIGGIVAIFVVALYLPIINLGQQFG